MVNPPPVMFLITDGNIWEANSLIDKAKKEGHRIFVIGVGAAPAESVLLNLARETDGACEFVTENENMAESIVRMFHRMRGKVAINIHIDWAEKAVWQAELPRFIHDGETVHSFAFFDKRSGQGPTLSWQAGGIDYTDKIRQIEVSENSDLARFGRSCQMRESVSESEKLSIALKYQLVSDLPSLILVYERADGDKKSLPKIQQVPQMRAHGHGNYTASSPFCASVIGVMTKNIIDYDISRNNVVRPLWSSWWNLGKKLLSQKTDSFELRVFLAEISVMWQSRLFQINSLQDFITDIEGDKKYEPVIKFLQEFVKNAEVSKEAVYAVMIEMMLQES